MTAVKEHHIICTPPGEKVQLTRFVINRSPKRENRKILKVVGASWFQTRVSSYIIAAMSVLGIIAIIMGEFGSKCMEDGNYAATVFWRQKANFKIEFWGQGNDLKKIPEGAARAYFRPDLDKTGWSVLEIETSPAYPDWVQAYAAGLLEGSLTWQSIYWHWQNTMEALYEQSQDECEELYEFLEENEEIVRSIMEKKENDPFWHQVRLFYAQIEGIETGWRYAVKRSRQDIDIPSSGFMWMNIASDLDELKRKFNFSQNEFTVNKTGFSSAFIKINNSTNLKNEKELYIAHNTATNYNNMLRILKRYQFNFHVLDDFKSASLVPGTRITFTGYPGAISSHDDFYSIKSTEKMIDHNLIVTGTTINIFNQKLWSRIESEDLILLGPRVMAANRLASGAQQWSEIIRLGGVGTGNKQWLVTDLKMFNQEQFVSPGGGLVWLVEQVPDKTYASDITHEFFAQGYWATYGIPYNQDMRKISGTNQMEEEYGVEFSYTKSTKAQYFAKNHNICNSFHDTVVFMRNITGPPSVTDIALRGDLLPDKQPFGTIDTKAVTMNTKNKFDMQIVSGPPHTQIDELALISIFKNSTSSETADSAIEHLISNNVIVQPFRWSTATSAFNEIKHNGHPDVWTFHPIRPVWIWE